MTPLIEEIRKENRRLKNDRLCKVCVDTDAIKVFLPCGHLSDCRECHHVNTCPAGRAENVLAQKGQETQSMA